MARWLRTGALLCAALAAVLVLIVPPDAWGAISIVSFNCGQVFGVNAVNGNPPYYVVGFNSSGSGKGTYAGFQANAATVMGSCGNPLNVPNAVSTFPAAISPDGFVTGVYNPIQHINSANVQGVFVMPISPNNTSGTVLTFYATQSGDPSAYSGRTTGISASTNGIAWVVGAYLTNSGHSSHAFAVQVNTSNVPPTIVPKSWISFDISVAGTGWARGVDGAGKTIVGSYPDANGKQQGYLLAITDLVAASKTATVPVMPVSSIATLTCSGAVGGYIHGIADNARVVGIAFTTNSQGYAFYADGAWVKGTTNTACTQIPVPGAKNGGQTWASGISSDGTHMVGQGGGGDWVWISTP